MRVECLTPDQQEWAYEVWCIGATTLHIADALGVSDKTIKRVLAGRTRVRPVLKYNPRWRKDGVTFRRTSLYQRTCKICGKEFETAEYRTAICSDECKKIAKAGYDARAKKSRTEYYQRHKEVQRLKKEATEREERNPALSLAEASRQAREMGMSYGEYMTFLRECGRCR